MTQNEGNKNPEKILLKGNVEITKTPQDHLEHSVDAKHARESTRADQQRAQEANKDRHSGSAGGHGDSIEVVVRDSHGHEKVAASRHKGGTEKDIEKYEANRKSISRDELGKLADAGEISASKLLERLIQAKSEEERKLIQKEADQLFGRGEFAPQQQRENNLDTSTDAPSKLRLEGKVNTNVLKAIETDTQLPEDKRQLAKYLQDMRTETKKLGGNTDAIDSFAQTELQKEIERKETGSSTGNTDELKSQILRSIIKHEIDDIKRSVGVVHGTLNFVVNTLAGVGNAVRMASAAAFEATPIGLICPDLYPDKDATKMLHETEKGIFTTGRVLTQLQTTFNPTSPLFGVEYDPEGAALTRALAKALPTKVSEELEKFANADPEAQTAVATEAILNIVMLIEGGGVGGAAKAGEIGQAGSIVKVSEETAALSEVAQAAKIANASEKLTPAWTAAKAVAKNLEEHAGIFNALAEKKPSLKPLADKFKECLTNFNEATKPKLAVAGGGTLKGEGVVDVIQSAGQQVKASTEGAGKKLKDYVNYMVKKGDGEVPNVKEGRGNEPPSEGKGSKSERGEKSDVREKEDRGQKEREVPENRHPWGASEADITLTKELIDSGRAEIKKAIFGHSRLRRLDSGDARKPMSWEVFGEVFSSEVPRQQTEASCVNSVMAELSKGRFTEAELIEKFDQPAPMTKTANAIGWRFKNIDPGHELSEIETMCKNGPWAANLYDLDGHHNVIVKFKNAITERLRIHDHLEGTKYEMTINEFIRVWNGDCVFK